MNNSICTSLIADSQDTSASNKKKNSRLKPMIRANDPKVTNLAMVLPVGVEVGRFQNPSLRTRSYVTINTSRSCVIRAVSLISLIRTLCDTRFMHMRRPCLSSSSTQKKLSRIAYDIYMQTKNVGAFFFIVPFFFFRYRTCDMRSSTSATSSSSA